jgi:hypothetical protein
MYIERNLAWVDSEDEPIAMARQWAIGWIDARDGEVASTDADSPTSHDDMPAKAPRR